MVGKLENDDNDTSPEEEVENNDKVQRKRSKHNPENDRYGRNKRDDN